MVILVLHFSTFIPALWPWPGPVIWTVIFRNGYYGVTMFFVISGFLIAHNAILRDGTLCKIDVRSFYLTRAARIYPALILTIVIVVLLMNSGFLMFVDNNGADVEASVFNLLIFHYDAYAAVHPVLPAWSPLWSIAIEGTSYLLFPILCRCCFRDRIIIIPLIAALIISPILRLNYHIYIAMWAGCVDQMAIGVMLAMATTSRFFSLLPSWSGVVLRVLGGAVIIMVYVSSSLVDAYIIGPTLIALGTATFLAGSQVRRPSATRLGKVIAWPFRLVEMFGRRSYELYLFHFIALLLAKEWLDAHPRIEPYSSFTLPAYLLLMLAVSSVIASCYTNPLERLIKRRFGRRRQLSRRKTVGGLDHAPALPLGTRR